MKQYLDLVKRVFDTGIRVPDRTGAGRIRSFGHRLEFDLNDGFPLVTARQIFTTRKGLISSVGSISAPHL